MNAFLLLILFVVAKAGSESGAVSAGGGSFDSACTDSTTWHKKGDDKKNCAWVGKKKVNRCKAWVKSEDGVKAKVACPVACGTCLLICEEAKQDLEETLAEEKQTCAEEKQTCAEEKQTCEEEKAALEGPSCADSETWYQGTKKWKTCAWVGKSPANRCKDTIMSKGGVTASDACPVACDACPTWAEVTEHLEEILAEEKQTCAEEKQTCAEEKAALEGPSCADSTTWHQGTKKSKTCEWVGEAPANRCKTKSKSKVLASDACPVACDACPTWAEVTEDLTEVTEALTEALTEVTETCDAAEVEYAALEAVLEEVVADKTEAQGNVTTLEAKNAELTAELEEAVADKAEAQGNVTTLEAKIAALEAAKASGEGCPTPAPTPFEASTVPGYPDYKVTTDCTAHSVSCKTCVDYFFESEPQDWMDCSGIESGGKCYSRCGFVQVANGTNPDGASNWKANNADRFHGPNPMFDTGSCIDPEGGGNHAASFGQGPYDMARTCEACETALRLYDENRFFVSDVSLPQPSGTVPTIGDDNCVST